jgi:hypothetical protein
MRRVAGGRDRDRRGIVALGRYLYLPAVAADERHDEGQRPVRAGRHHPRPDAIPHIFAANKADGLFGLGYAHAQDRLWQMELQRRIGHGRLSEVLGSAALPQDRFLRTVGFGRAAKTAWASTPDWAKQQIDAYVAGVNAFLSTHHGSALPPEFTLLRFEPEPWSGVDVIVWVKMMAWDLSANYSFELLRHDLVNAVGPERMAQLMRTAQTVCRSCLTGRSGEIWVRWGSTVSTALTRPTDLPAYSSGCCIASVRGRSLASAISLRSAARRCRIQQLGRGRHDDRHESRC